MSTAEMTLLFQAAERKGACRSPESALRIVLIQGEVLRVPPTHGTLRVLSGTAWVSVDGKDVLLSRGEFVNVGGRADRPVVSGLGRDPLLFEVC